jgi:hypothetical protein
LTNVEKGGFGLYKNKENEEFCVFLGADAISIDVSCDAVFEYTELDLKEHPQCIIETKPEGIKVSSRNGKDLVLNFQTIDEGDEIIKEIVELKKTTFSFPKITRLPFNSKCGWMFKKESPCNYIIDKT